MLHFAELREGPFKLLDLDASYKSGAVQQGMPGVSELAAKPVVLALQIHERHEHLFLMTRLFNNLLRHYPLPSVPRCLKFSVEFLWYRKSSLIEHSSK